MSSSHSRCCCERCCCDRSSDDSCHPGHPPCGHPEHPHRGGHVRCGTDDRHARCHHRHDDCRGEKYAGEPCPPTGGPSPGGGPPCPPSGDGRPPGTGNPNRPTRNPGTIHGGLGGGPITIGQINSDQPPTSWSGPRHHLWLPYLFIRAMPGDTGARPVAGTFWESPDIYILPGVPPHLAPSLPPTLGDVALAGKDNTIYGHVWNLGRAPAREVVVEFYACNPTLGFNPVGARLVGTAFTTLGARGSGDCHRVVKCPESWNATYFNGGHECLLVRVWDVAADPMTTPEWDASINRHLGQRNIHVVPAGQQLTQPLKLNVGQLFGMPAQVNVARTAPTGMPWLQLHTGVRGGFPGQAPPTGAVVVGTPGHVLDQDAVAVTQDGADIALGTSDDAPPPGSAHVYRVTANQQGQVFGGYTVVVLG